VYRRTVRKPRPKWTQFRQACNFHHHHHHHDLHQAGLENIRDRPFKIKTNPRPQLSRPRSRSRQHKIGIATKTAISRTTSLQKLNTVLGWRHTRLVEQQSCATSLLYDISFTECLKDSVYNYSSIVSYSGSCVQVMTSCVTSLPDTVDNRTYTDTWKREILLHQQVSGCQQM